MDEQFKDLSPGLLACRLAEYFLARIASQNGMDRDQLAAEAGRRANLVLSLEYHIPPGCPIYDAVLIRFTRKTPEATK